MLAQNIENGFFAIKVEMKEKEWELLKELRLAINKGNSKLLSSSVRSICTGRAQAYLQIYEKFFGVLCKNKDSSLNNLKLQHKTKSVLKELKELLKS